MPDPNDPPNGCAKRAETGMSGNCCVAPDKLDNAVTVVTTMFGDGSIGRSAAGQDSSQLSDMAKTFADPQKVILLRSGKSLLEVLDSTQPTERKLEAYVRGL